MRVISGTARGRKLQSLPGEHTRPTADRVKEAMFSILQFDLPGRRVLDLFAGSGQLGIEALSRGAASCVFVESDRGALEVARRNVEHCGFEQQAMLQLSDYTAYLGGRREKFDIILVDPPYESGLHTEVLARAGAIDILNINGIMVFESLSGLVLPEQAGNLRRGREYRYGKTKLTLYHEDH